MSHAYVPKALRDRVAAEASHRCGYSLTQEAVVGFSTEMEHLIPEALEGPTEEDDLWLACSPCNAAKGDRISAPHPAPGAPPPRLT